MLNLNEYDPNRQTSDGARRYFNYEGFFGGILRRDCFGLHRGGTLYIDVPQNKIGLMGETPLPLFISIPLSFIPIVGRAIRTFYRPSADFSFQLSDVKEIVRKGSHIQFKAPKRAGGKLKRVEFSAKTEAETQEIENLIRQHNPDITPGKLVTSWRLVKLGAMAAAGLLALLLVLLVGAGIMRYWEKPESVYVTTNQRLSGNYNRKPITFNSSIDYPEAAKGMFQRGGDIFLDITVSPEGDVTDVQINEKEREKYPSITIGTKKPVLIEAAINAARQIKYQPDKAESRYQIWYKFSTRFDRALDPTRY